MDHESEISTFWDGFSEPDVKSTLDFFVFNIEPDRMYLWGVVLS